MKGILIAVSAIAVLVYGFRHYRYWDLIQLLLDEKKYYLKYCLRKYGADDDHTLYAVGECLKKKLAKKGKAVDKVMVFYVDGNQYRCYADDIIYDVTADESGIEYC